MARKRTEEEQVVSIARSTTPRFVAMLLVAGLLIVGGAIFIGKSDSGQINVAGIIQDENSKRVDSEGNPNNQVGTVNEAFQNMPNGGLVPSDNQSPQEVPPEPEVTETSSTTEAGATEETTDESGTSEDTQTEVQ